MLKLPWILPLKRPNFQFKRIKLGLNPPTVPPSYIFALCLGLVFYIFSGGVYLLIHDKVFAYYADERDPHFIYREDGQGPGACYTNIQHQYINEGIAAGLLILLGFLGLLILIQAVKDPHNPDRAFNYQLFGVILITLAFLILEGMMSIKGC